MWEAFNFDLGSSSDIDKNYSNHHLIDDIEMMPLVYCKSSGQCNVTPENSIIYRNVDILSQML
jgi:hypothetical protein